MRADIFIVETDAEIASCFPVFSALRPHLKEGDFLPQVRRQEKQSYRIVALKHEGAVRSVAGYRFAEFLAWGRVLYIDDLATLPGETGRGYGGALLEWLINHAKEGACDAVHLDTGYARHAAHRLYLNKGFKMNSHHMALELRTK